MWPKMVYSRTFRFSQRALRHFGVDTVLDDLIPGVPLTLDVFMKTLLKLSMKNTGFIIIAARNFERHMAHAGWTFVVYCLPLLKCSHCGTMEHSRDDINEA